MTIEEQLNKHLNEYEKSVVMLLKIEEFKYLKHSFTEKITHKLQHIFAEELSSYMPETCNFSHLYQLHNGEFAFVKEYNELMNENDMTAVIDKFQKNINQKKIKIGIVDYHLTIVISLAYGKNALENAKIGLKRISKTKEKFIIATNFIEEERRTSHKKLNQFIMLKEAIASYNIVSHFQPIIDNQTLEVIKYESLVRLIDKDNNIISPYHFLETAKEGKYYHEITSIVLGNSFRALFNNNINISINLSAIDIEDRQIRNEFFILLEKYKTVAHRVTVELVEDERIKSRIEVQDFLKKIKEKGVKVALDDFGKGLSNFTRIQYYQPDYIKIDGGLIKNIEHDEFSKDLVETIVFFAKKQNIKTIAEFVKNENVYNILKELGVDYSQGHYFGSAKKLEEIISSYP